MRYLVFQQHYGLLQNTNFVYEISCDQMCGAGHFSMRGVIVVQKPEEYKKWLAEQKPEYFTLFKDKEPKPDTAVVAVKDPKATLAMIKK
jgi:cytochrome c oxidase subunit II